MPDSSDARRKTGAAASPWFAAVAAQLSAVYGPAEAIVRQATVLPGILEDFRKMLLASDGGRTVTETYHCEDGRLTVVLEGRRQKVPSGDRLTITRTVINGRTVTIPFILASP